MLRLIPRRRLPLGYRSLVSSALLSRSWKNETIPELRNEAKRLGLSPKGNKATLVLRLEDNEKGLTFGQHPIGIRRPSSSNSTPYTEVPGNPDLPSVASTSFLNVKLPDLSAHHPVPPVQVPYVPDFWNSTPLTAEVQKDEKLPKLLVVAGADTHHGGGPSHNLLDLGSTSENPEVASVAPQERRSDTFLDDILEEIGLPPTYELKAGLWKIFS